MTGTRAQSAVIGVALLMVITVVSIGVLTAGTGVLVDEAGRNADVQRVTDRLLEGYEPRTLLGGSTISLPVTGGTLETVPRTIEIRRAGSPVEIFETAGIRYRRAGHSVTAVGQAILRDRGGRARFIREPRLVRVFESGGKRVLSISVVLVEDTLDHTVHRAGEQRLTVMATHERRMLEPGRYAIALETTAPEAWERALEDLAKWIRIEERGEDGRYRLLVEFGRVHEVRLVVTHVEVRADG